MHVFVDGVNYTSIKRPFNHWLYFKVSRHKYSPNEAKDNFTRQNDVDYAIKIISELLQAETAEGISGRQSSDE